MKLIRWLVTTHPPIPVNVRDGESVRWLSMNDEFVSEGRMSFSNFVCNISINTF